MWFCVRTGCTNDISNGGFCGPYCSSSCYYYMRARNPRRRLYKAEYDKANHEKRRDYGRWWREKRHGPRYMAHVYAWQDAGLKRTVHRYSHKFFAHVNDYYVVKRGEPKLRNWDRRDVKRQVALRLFNELAEQPNTPKSRRQLRMQQWRRDNAEWLKEYKKQYTATHAEQVRERTAERRRRSRVRGQAAIAVLKEMGVEL